MARSVWEEATPEARAGLKSINQYVGATPGKRTGPGSPGYMRNKSETPARQASIGRRLEAQTQRYVADSRLQMAKELQQARFAREDTNALKALSGGSSRLGNRNKQKPNGLSTLNDKWKYGEADPITGLPKYRTNSSGMQKYIPGEVDKSTGLPSSGRFGETIGGNAPEIMPEEGVGTIKGRANAPYSQTIFQRKDGVFTNVGTPNFAKGDRNIMNSSGGFDRNKMSFQDNSGNYQPSEDEKRFALIQKKLNDTPPEEDPPEEDPPEVIPKVPTGDYMPPEEGFADISGQFQDTPLYQGTKSIVQGTSQFGKDFVAQYDKPLRKKTIPQLGSSNRHKQSFLESAREPSLLENLQEKQFNQKLLGINEDPLLKSLNTTTEGSMINLIKGTTSKMDALGKMNMIKDPAQRKKFYQFINEKYGAIS